VLGDYNWIDCPKCKDPLCCGRGWYTDEEAEYLLEHGSVTWDGIRQTFTASCHMEGLQELLKALESIWQEARATSGDFSIEPKHALNAMLGLWSIVENRAYRLTSSTEPQDMLPGVCHVSPSPGSDGMLLDYVQSTRLLGFESMRPIHQLCLGGERLWMARMLRAMSRLPGTRVLSVRNDGGTIESTRMPAVKRWLAAQKHPSGAPVFKFEPVSEPDLPGGTLDRGTEQPPLVLQDLPWTHIYESAEAAPILDVAKAHVVQAQRPALFGGPPGTGKSTALIACCKALCEAGGRLRPRCCCGPS
jgi:hypothetical protein